MPIGNDYDQPRKNYFSSEDSSFASGDSPATLDVFGTINRESIKGTIDCDGAGDITVSLSSDGTTYGNNITLKKYEQLDLTGSVVRKIKITHTGTDSAYRVRCS